jgi:DNA-binding NarL/FixJ family response regulator
LEYSQSASFQPKAELVSKFSARELDILYELQTDVSNAEIAHKLFLSENTVKHHVHNILEKLGVTNRREAGTIARQMGLGKGGAIGPKTVSEFSRGVNP